MVLSVRVPLHGVGFTQDGYTHLDQIHIWHDLLDFLDNLCLLSSVNLCQSDGKDGLLFWLLGFGCCFTTGSGSSCWSSSYWSRDCDISNVEAGLSRTIGRASAMFNAGVEAARKLKRAEIPTLSVDTSSAASSKLSVEIWSTIWLILGDTLALDDACAS